MENQRNTIALVNFVRAAHHGQVDKSGFDYFETHLSPVARSVPDDLYFAALAHDLLEDTKATVDDMRDAGFSQSEIDLVETLTKTDEPYLDYLAKIAIIPQARTIKVMDVVNNLSRMHNIKDEQEFARLVNKYITALAHLRF